MTDKLYIYCILGALAIVCVLAFALKLEKIVQIIVGNFVLGWLFFSLNFCIDLLFTLNPDGAFMKFLSDAKIWILLVLYGLSLFFFVYRKSKIRIDFSSDSLIYKPLYLVYVPLVAMSMIITIGFIVLGQNAFSLVELNSISNFTQNIYLQKFITNFPYIVCGYSFLALLAISDLNFKIKVSVDNS